ncbi:MAG: DMT family transporter [Actinomycetota bacterium]|nr:DMT family transporter [Actinomycetota bacterium]
MTRRGWILFATLSVVWGVPYLLIRVAVHDYDPVVVAGGRTLLGALVLLPIAIKRGVLAPIFRRWRVLVLYTVVEIIGPWWLLGWGETKLTSSTAGLLIAVVPLIAAVLLTRLGHDSLDGRRILGLLIGFAGVGTLVGLDIHLDNLAAVGAVLLTAIGYAGGAIIINRYLGDLPTLGVVTASLALAALVYLPFAILRRPTVLTAGGSWSVIGLALICTVGAFLLLFALVAEVGAARATVITYVNPAVAIMLGILILGEPFTIGVAIGFPLVIAGAILATGRARLRPDHTAEPARPAGHADPAVPTGPPIPDFTPGTPSTP